LHTGSTVPYVVERIFGQGPELNNDRVFIPTGLFPNLVSDILYYISLIAGFQSKELIVASQLNLGDVDQYPTIDVTFDGADE
jgi:ribose 5-phosphate isomerase A